jgi:DNA-binding IclR family transcriptional regulator
MTHHPLTSRKAGAVPGDSAVNGSSGSAASVQSVGVAFALVEELANASDPIGVSELARCTGHTKARVHRHLSTLRELGFVEKDAATDRYRLGWKLFRLGMALAENFDLRRTARLHLLRLHDRVGQTVVLAMPADGQVTIVDAIQSRDDVAITVRPGSLMPCASSALGRVIIAFQNPAVEPAGANAARLSLIRQRWYEVAVNERLAGVSAIAAPIFDEANQIAASVGIVAVGEVLRDPPDPAMTAHLHLAAAAISADMRSTLWSEAATVLQGSGSGRRRSKARVR